MDAEKLTPQQIAKLHDKIREIDHYFFELQGRMQAKKWYSEDRLYIEVCTARYAVRTLLKHLHAMTCGPSYRDLLDS